MREVHKSFYSEVHGFKENKQKPTGPCMFDVELQSQNEDSSWRISVENFNSDRPTNT